jgi:Bacterial Ig-like domain (group 2)
MQKSTKTLLLVVLTVALISTMMMFTGCSSSSSDSGGGATLSSIAVTPANGSVQVGSTQAFTATGTYSDGSQSALTSVTWSSSSTSVATINAAGMAMGVAEGSTTITATSGSISGSATLTVTAAAATTYSATLYMASEAGGHIGVFPVTIDPSNATSPIVVDENAVSKIQLKGGPSSSTKVVFHDVRLDDPSNGGANATKIYYSAIMSEASNSTVADIGYVNLGDTYTSTNNGVNSVIDIDTAAADAISGALDAMGVGTGMRILYCASGVDQQNGYYFPMSMSLPAYIDAVPESLLDNGAKGAVTNELKTTDFKRTYTSDIFGTETLGAGVDAFIHGASSPDGSVIYASTNVVSNVTPTDNLLGVIKAVTMHSSDLEAGTMSTSNVISSGSYTVRPNIGSIAYRASFTPDGTYILQAANDSMLIIKASDLSLYDDTYNDTVKVGGGMTGIEVHDVTYTPDSKYAILAIRYFADSTQESAGVKTSGLQLYDIANKTFIGGITNTCGLSACHDKTGDGTTRPTCGVVGVFN